MNPDVILSTQDIFTIIGLVAGLVCGAVIGRNSIYYSMNKTNMLGYDELDDPSNQLDSATRFNLGAVGGLFLIIGITICIIASYKRITYEYPTADKSVYDIYEKEEIDRMLAEEDEKTRNELNMIIVFSFLSMGMGGLVLVPAVTGKRRT